MGYISPFTLQKLVVLNTIKQFKKGVFGKKRLQKTLYMIHLDNRFPYRLFKYISYNYGAYSRGIQNSLEHLISLGFVTPESLDTVNDSGNIFLLNDNIDLEFFHIALAHSHRNIIPAIRDTVKKYGYLSENELANRTKESPEFLSTLAGDTIWEMEVPEQIKINLDQHDIEDLELALNPSFVMAMSKIAQGLSKPGIDLSKVKHIVKSV